VSGMGSASINTVEGQVETIDQTVTGAATRTDPDDEADLPDPNLLRVPRSCYTCKIRFKTVHHFYDSMCVPLS
jgi:hypothetical protein